MRQTTIHIYAQVGSAVYRYTTAAVLVCLQGGGHLIDWVESIESGVSGIVVTYYIGTLGNLGAVLIARTACNLLRLYKLDTELLHHTVCSKTIRIYSFLPLRVLGVCSLPWLQYNSRSTEGGGGGERAEV